ncbi:MAG TPA: serine/threonine protein kinase [Planctomycetes bacterium]|nr:serine/threonine protein kinase [Planctomycetota bacterium]
MIVPKNMEPLDHPPKNELESLGESNWERFYREFRKPGYIPGYEIQQKLGGGVFGVVFKAKKESIGKAYAIKFLRVEDPSVRKQVLNELETVSLFAQVDHPNLVTIEDKGMVDGIPYIIMGFAGDETLKSRLEEGRLSQVQAQRFMKQVFHGVKALHDHGLAHFDLKPANLFVHGDIVRVGDYGLSKLIRESCSGLSFGRGTPYYMAPEMLRRKGDQRSDIYSLGVIFYECLTGTVPFEGENEWEVLKAHEERSVVFPSEVPEGLKPILRRMLAKDPQARVQDLGEVLDFLEGHPDWVVGEPKQVSQSASPLPPVPTPPPLPSIASGFSTLRRRRGRRGRESKWRAHQALGVALFVAILVLRGWRSKTILSLGLLVAMALFLFFLITGRTSPRTQEWRNRSRFHRRGAPRPSRGGGSAILLLTLGLFLFLGFFLFLFLGVSSPPSSSIHVQRVLIPDQAKSPERLVQPVLVPAVPIPDFPDGEPTEERVKIEAGK